MAGEHTAGEVASVGGGGRPVLHTCSVPWLAVTLNKSLHLSAPQSGSGNTLLH